jgi:ABC-2 type transport system ATP-binding protein
LAVSELSFDLAEGEVLAFLGPNGAGKTTTIKMVAALIQPDSGTVLIGGIDPYKHPSCLNYVGAILESNRNVYWRLSVLENVEYFSGIRGRMSRREARSRATEFLQRFGLAERVNTPVATLSRGMQQKVAIVLALIHRPRLLLLDEPTLGLDLAASRDMVQIIKEMASEGIGILLTTHQLTLAESLAHNVLIIKAGRKLLHCPLQAALQVKQTRSYSITILSDLAWPQQRRVAELGAVIQQRTVTFSGSSETLYRILDLLKPAEIDEIKTSARSLDDVFTEITHDDRAIVIR